jgi:hypothetical protein
VQILLSHQLHKVLLIKIYFNFNDPLHAKLY